MGSRRVGWGIADEAAGCHAAGAAILGYDKWLSAY